MKFVFISAYRKQYAVERMCRVLEVSRAGYYAWRKRKPSVRQQANARLLEKIQIIHLGSHKRYGAPRVYAALRREGWKCGHNRIARLMRQHQIQAWQRRAWVRTTRVDPRRPVAPNLLGRAFIAQHPNQKWVSDITYIPTQQGWLYLAVIMDLFSRKIVGWSMAERMQDDLVQKAIRMALRQRSVAGELLLHSDRGSQYTSAAYQKLLAAKGILVSMSRTGNCYDNAAMESFFSTLKKELVFRQSYTTRSQARQDLFAYIEGFYNLRRLHSALGFLSPVEVELSYHRSLSSLSTESG